MNEQLAQTSLNGLEFPYPSEDILKEKLKFLYGCNEQHRYFIRSWWTEGIPYVFSKSPADYEALRQWLGKELDINPRSITLIGSARFGYSIVPKREGSSKFSSDSDLDFFAVSEFWFDSLKNEFQDWKIRYINSEIKPSDSEDRFWKDNKDQVPKNINNGFIDAKYIPTRDSFPKTMQIRDIMFRAKKNFKYNSVCNLSRVFNIRVYRSWDDVDNQLILNLNKIIKQLG